MKLKRGYYDVLVRTCAKYPSNIAVRNYENGAYKTYTYSEMYGICEYISQNLQQMKCTKGVIGLVSERNIIIPCVIAAVHKCCTTFMFIDPGQNIMALSKNITFATIIAIKKSCDSVPEFFNKTPERTVTIFDLAIHFYNCDPCIKQDYKYINQHSFIAMTSGSTGEPKHIQVPIKCIQPNINDLTKMFNITPQDIIYFSTPLTFDPSMVEILLACLNGASLLIAPESIDIIFSENKENSITFWQTTPSRFFIHSNSEIENKILCPSSSLKILALGGEPFNCVKRLKQLKHDNNKTKVFTLYGVTEMSCWACVAELNLNRDKEVPLGTCLSETEITVEPFKHENKSTGKIILMSKTRKCFIINKTGINGEENSLKFIDTGDIGEIKNGTIYYRGRKDDIIKRFGHKVNLQLIESTIMLCPRVKTCSCVWLPKPSILVVYFASENLRSQELSDFLKCKLDEKYWPDKIIRVDNLPINPHGKISKNLIAKLYDNVTGVPQTSETLKASFLKELLLSICNNVSYEDIKDKDFISIGGTSFVALSLCNKLSLVCPQFGSLILPYLLSQKHTISEIIQIAQKEICPEDHKPRKKIRRLKSNETSNKDKPLLQKGSNSISVPVYFVNIWKYDTGKCVDASPTLFQTGLYLYVTVGSHSGKIVVIDAITGVTQSVITIKSRIEASVLCFETPTPRGVVGSYDGTVVCFEMRNNGKILWSKNIGSMIKSKAVCCNGSVYIASYDGKIWLLDIMTGTLKNSIHIADQPISADLVLAKQQYILLGTLSGTCASIHCPTNSVVWRGTIGSPVFSSPVLYDNENYVVFAEVNGDIHCRTVDKGITIWVYKGAKGNIFSSLYVKEVEKMRWQMVFGCHDSKVYNIGIKNFQPNLNWTVALNAPVYATPCGLNNDLIISVSNDGQLCVIDSTNGIIVSKYDFPNEVFSSPAVYSNYIYIGCRNDNLYCLKYSFNL